MTKLTFSDNALDTDHRADELRKKVSWSNTTGNKRTFKAHKNMFSFLQVLRVNIACPVCRRITEWLQVLNWILEKPKFSKSYNQNHI